MGTEQKVVTDVNHEALIYQLYFCIVFCGCSPQVLLSRILEKNPYILRNLEKKPYILRKMSNTLYRMALKPIL